MRYLGAFEPRCDLHDNNPSKYECACKAVPNWSMSIRNIRHVTPLKRVYWLARVPLTAGRIPQPRTSSFCVPHHMFWRRGRLRLRTRQSGYKYVVARSFYIFLVNFTVLQGYIDAESLRAECRPERVLWFGVQLTNTTKHIQYDTTTHRFSA